MTGDERAINIQAIEYDNRNLLLEIEILIVATRNLERQLEELKARMLH